LDQHQVRRWRCWYQWVTLTILAHAFLATERRAESRRLLPASLHLSEQWLRALPR
jgi:hypothetical protein